MHTAEYKTSTGMLLVESKLIENYYSCNVLVLTYSVLVMSKGDESYPCSAPYLSHSFPGGFCSSSFLLVRHRDMFHHLRWLAKWKMN